MNSINCTNPGCGKSITIPKGASFVTCPSCDTWHMLDESPPSSASSSDSSSFDAESYYSPLSDESDLSPPDYNEFNPPTPADQDYYSSIDNTPSSDLTPDPFQRDDQIIPPNYDVTDGEAVTPPEHPIQQTPIAFLRTTTGQRLILKEGKNYIGRQGTDLIIQDKTVSRRHCVVDVNKIAGGQWEYFIYDIGYLEGKASSNGVFTGGRSLRLQNYERVPIYLGNSIQLGNVYLTLQNS